MTAYLRNVPLLVGGVGVIAIAIVAVFGRELAPLDPNAENWLVLEPDRIPPYRFPPTAPDPRRWLGTDGLGRDLLSRFLAGAELTFAVVGISLGVRMGAGVALGAIAGWSTGVVGEVARRLIAAASSMPQLLVALVLVLLLREHGPLGFGLALALVGWGEVASFTHDRLRALRGAVHIEAARAMGADEWRVVRSHALRMVVPSLLSVAALEAGAVLLLLAELGVIGVFVAGATYYVYEDTGQPILPLRDRAPEWGQMLAGLQVYGNEARYIVLIPALVVSAAVFVFNVLGEGLRLATDPHSDVRLSPRAIGALTRAGSLGLALTVVVLATGSFLRTEVDLISGHAIAAETARKTLPDAKLVAAVVRFSAAYGALAKPEKINFYYYDRAGADLLRVGFVGGERHAMEVQPGNVEDPVVPLELPPLDADLAMWDKAFAESQHVMGASFRRSFPSYEVHLIALRPSEGQPARFEVRYRSGSTRRTNCCFDMTTGKLMPGTDHH